MLGLVALTLVSSLAGGGESVGLVLLKILGFFIFAAVAGVGANRLFCWMLKRQGGWATHRNSVLAFVLCLVMAYCAEEFFGVADITGAMPPVWPWPAPPREPISSPSIIRLAICC